LSGTATIKNCTANRGGAIFANGKSGQVNLSAGEISNNKATEFGGGALRVEGSAKAVISGTALLTNNKAEGTGEKYGGAVNVKEGTLTMTGGNISGNSVNSTSNNISGGGAIHIGAKGSMVLSGGTIVGNTVVNTKGAGAGI
jgi:hypothetical protein